MRVATSRVVTSLAAAAVICLLAVDFAEARRGGRIGGGHRMMRGGPAASGAFNRSRARPRMNRPRPAPNRGMSRDLGGTRSLTGPRDPGNRLGGPGDYDRDMSRTVPRNPDPGNRETRPGNADTSLTRPQDPDAGSSVTVDEQRADQIRDNREDYDENRQDYYEDRQDYYEDQQDYYEDRWRAGAYISMATWGSMNCGFSTVIIDATTYYMCDGIRYERVYHGSEVIFIAVN